MIIETLAADLAVYAVEKGAKYEMDAQANEVIAKVKALVATKYNSDYMAAFKSYDLDHNGRLGHKDVGKLLDDCNVGNWLTRGVWATGIINQLDKDRDGTISIPELMAAFLEGAVFAPSK